MNKQNCFDLHEESKTSSEEDDMRINENLIEQLIGFDQIFEEMTLEDLFFTIADLPLEPKPFQDPNKAMQLQTFGQ